MIDKYAFGGSKLNNGTFPSSFACLSHVLDALWFRHVFCRMRNATILVVRVRGTATEAIKNIVLAGIGKLVLVDSDDVAEEDLGAGFFFRDEDVGNNVRHHPVHVRRRAHSRYRLNACLPISCAMRRNNRKRRLRRLG